MPGYWGAGNALAWLRDERALGVRRWQNLCAGLAANAAGYTSSGANANDWARDIPQALRHDGIAGKPGRLQFWAGGTYGHVGWTLGNGILLCNLPNGAVGRMNAGYYANIRPTFWVDPGDNPDRVFRMASGTQDRHPRPIRPTMPGWPLRPGDSDPRIIHVKAALDWPNREPRYGDELAARVVRWKRRHGLPATPRIGPAAYARLTAP